jgi:hypothetical protein
MLRRRESLPIDQTRIHTLQRSGGLINLPDSAHLSLLKRPGNQLLPPSADSAPCSFACLRSHREPAPSECLDPEEAGRHGQQRVQQAFISLDVAQQSEEPVHATAADLQLRLAHRPDTHNLRLGSCSPTARVVLCTHTCTYSALRISNSSGHWKTMH